MFSTAADLFQPNRTVYVQEMERKRIEGVQTPSPDGPPDATRQELS